MVSSSVFLIRAYHTGACSHDVKGAYPSEPPAEVGKRYDVFDVLPVMDECVCMQKTTIAGFISTMITNHTREAK